eukprot:CAMPEP_0172521922 /NCGR_PEP_ID=MMETSP1066-20121228/292847_1 /TAXON_ID=671091 /ORGANISM="Coscinodiscus wailesii, Strain CCMP2513" /LENGTH=165 /DNA_ID=CAMNT_0013304885 /DNA_START=114 /DNA_END=611 /DNA_ORIENTATION=+
MPRHDNSLSFLDDITASNNTPNHHRTNDPSIFFLVPPTHSNTANEDSMRYSSFTSEQNDIATLFENDHNENFFLTYPNRHHQINTCKTGLAPPDSIFPPTSSQSRNTRLRPRPYGLILDLNVTYDARDPPNQYATSNSPTNRHQRQSRATSNLEDGVSKMSFRTP